MKKLIFMFMCLFGLYATIACADNEKPVSVSQLPKKAQLFLQRHFPDRTVALAKMETELMSKSYEVYFANGEHIDFDGKGNWTEVDCKMSAVPADIVPAPIATYVKANYPDTHILKIEKDRKEYEVTLSNRMELSFDSKFNIMDIDL
ncbi:MAG: PepSY-like domain-containing protein [Prevotella sp.]|nr:PepSY-like domain-containing protein [Prevotella sp.]